MRGLIFFLYLCFPLICFGNHSKVEKNRNHITNQTNQDLSASFFSKVANTDDSDILAIIEDIDSDFEEESISNDDNNENGHAKSIEIKYCITHSTDFPSCCYILSKIPVDCISQYQFSFRNKIPVYITNRNIRI